MKTLNPQINVVCVKYGTKYTDEDVTRLYRMVERNLSLPFSFYCLSDTNIPGIQTIPLDMSLDLETYWWKMCLFNLNWNCPTIYFDLDIIIQNNFDYIIQDYNDKIHCIDVRDTGAHMLNDGTDDTPLTIPLTTMNSSVMLFTPIHHADMYERFIANVDYNIIAYFGVDRFISNLFEERLERLQFRKDYYFRNQHPEGWDVDYIDKTGLYKDPRVTFCIITQAIPEDYKNMEEYFL
mgnify:FL=1